MKKAFLVALSVISLSCHGQDPAIGSYFQDLCLRYLGKFVALDKSRFDSTCSQYGLDNVNPDNIRQYYSLVILHELFTATTAADGASGFILKIPYFWHYRTPNPRHEILVDGRVNVAYTSIERKPHVFLKDLAAQLERFSHPVWGSFPTFGWCSEREMAFTCLLTTMGYNAHVIAPGSHAVTEVEIPFYTTQGEKKTLVASVDNTFYGMAFFKDTSDHHNIYDTRALAPAEVRQVKDLTISAPARARIEAAMDKYLAERQ